MRKEKCITCRGVGMLYGMGHMYKQCSICKGAGHIIVEEKEHEEPEVIKLAPKRGRKKKVADVEEISG